MRFRLKCKTFRKFHCSRANWPAISANGQTQFRPEPMRLRWTLSNLIASDGHKLQGTFACSVRPLTEAAERKVFAEVFLATKPSVRGDDVVAHFNPRPSSPTPPRCTKQSISSPMISKSRSPPPSKSRRQTRLQQRP